MRILLGVSGGIAAYKALELVRLATGAGHVVRVVQTPTSRRFVGTASFAALSGAPVLVSEFQRDPARGAFPDQQPPGHDPIGHLELVANADLYLIAPASANTIAKLAAGLADNLLTSCALAAGCPLVIAPAMNSRMYEHPATTHNLDTLRSRGARIVEPTAGRLASIGEHGVGRMAEPATLLAACEELLAGRGPGENGDGAGGTLAGTRVLVTAGGTREAIDSVRFLGNSSSGRMGLALAGAARRRGAEVVLLCANVALEAPPGVRRVDVVSAEQLRAACELEFPAADVLLMAAAVADFAPAAASEGKIKKDGREGLTLALAPTVDILSELSGRRRDGQTLVGFAAEHGPAGLAGAEGKLTGKRLDALVVNDISRADVGFDVEDNEVTILTAAGGGAIERLHVERAPKDSVAESILEAVERLRGGAESV
ncbi:MAG TPA: bifunctional phosphopantothenoylcysteine decarboxylase/phosphopantothenate--cysteine ligase CoaBC [Myxococcales bacterium]|nr:bifunctional phosphopantothenoylcysteine decarboxylase/phosphopantothenate--cysteine ligase CoaBC [Myxococcales bacterium]